MKRRSTARAFRLARKYLSPSRYAHSLRTMEMALALGEAWAGDRKSLIEASLLHDLGYSFGGRALDHASIGARRAGMLGFDKRVLRMIEVHTVGASTMDLNEKILFLADGIERGRYYRYIASLRRLAFRNLDLALLAYIRSSEKYLKASGKSLHTDTRKFKEEIRRKYGRTGRKTY